MLHLFNILIAIFAGANAGRLIAVTVRNLPEILFDESDEREPDEVWRIFFRKPYCSECGHNSSFAASFPIIGFIFYGGKCTQCRKLMDKLTLSLELAMASLFGLTVAIFGLTAPVLFVLTATCFLVAAFLTDYKHFILPDQLTISLLWLGLIASLFPIFTTSKQAVLGAVAGYGFFWIFNAVYRYLRSLEGMYPGDFKLNAAIGACLGIYLLIPVILTSFVVLIVFSGVIYLVRMKKIDTGFLLQESPYGCFSSLITIVVLYYLLYQIQNVPVPGGS